MEKEIPSLIFKEAYTPSFLALEAIFSNIKGSSKTQEVPGLYSCTTENNIAV